MIANYHTHTYRCHHADGSEREYVERAIQNGLKTFGFSDHVPMPFPDGHQSGFRVRIEALEDYVRTVEQLREEYKADIDILLGFEAEYYPAHFEDMLALIGQYDYQYLLMGQHLIGNEERAIGAPHDDPALLRRYVDQVIEGLSTGKYTYLCHPDIPNFKGGDEDYEREMTRLCRACLTLDIPLEINLLGLEEHRHYPSDRFFRIVSKIQNPVILGCDAHHLPAVANQAMIAEGEAFAARYGLTLLDTVTLRNPKA